MQKQTYSPSKPFANSFIAETIQGLLFINGGMFKSDVRTSRRVYQEMRIPITLVLLAVTAVSTSCHELFAKAKRRPSCED